MNVAIASATMTTTTSTIAMTTAAAGMVTMITGLTSTTVPRIQMEIVLIGRIKIKIAQVDQTKDIQIKAIKTTRISKIKIAQVDRTKVIRIKAISGNPANTQQVALTHNKTRLRLQ